MQAWNFVTVRPHTIPGLGQKEHSRSTRRHGSTRGPHPRRTPSVSPFRHLPVDTASMFVVAFKNNHTRMQGMCGQMVNPTSRCAARMWTRGSKSLRHDVKRMHCRQSASTSKSCVPTLCSKVRSASAIGLRTSTCLIRRTERSCCATCCKRGGAVVTFYRGGWCPYCNIQLRAYQAILPEISCLALGWSESRRSCPTVLSRPPR